MAEEYIAPRIEVEPQDVLDEMNDEMAAALPGWVPSDAHLEGIIFPIVARLIAENREFASEVLTLIFRAWGAFLGVDQIEAAAASASTTWTAIDDEGYTIAEGAQVSIRSGTGEEVGFEVRDETVIPPGTTVAAGVVLVALVPGADGSNLLGEVTAIDGDLSWVSGIVLDGPTAGGVDEESPDDYVNREAAELRLLTRQPILARDFAVIALRTPGVGRALALDTYNPVDDSFDNELMVTLALIDDNGVQVSSDIKNQVIATLEALRGENFVINVMDPTYVRIAVLDFDAVAYPGFDPDEVKASVVAALQDYLHPKNWGRPGFGDPGAVPGWISDDTVRVSEISEQINRVEGVHYVSGIQIGVELNVGLEDSTDAATTNVPHGFNNGDEIVFHDLVGGAPIVNGTHYFVRDKTSTTFKIAATSGGAAIDITTETSTAAQVTKPGTADIPLDGVAALTVFGTIDGDVTGS